jgi:hypothetical protein
MIKKTNKKAVSIPLEWVFAMIVGAVILFLAIYGVSKLITGAEGFRGKETAEKIKAYLDPFETGLASGKSAEINFRLESKIYFDECNYLDNSPWGEQTIAFSEKTFGNRFSKKSELAYIKNKYVFSDNEITGKYMYIFSKPYFMGFKVADLIIINNKKYCFYQAPTSIRDEIDNLEIENINFSEEIEDCEGEIVCFDSNNPDCDTIVYGECVDNCESSYSYGKVIKESSTGKKQEMYYINNLWIGAVFSSSDLYECNVKRLMNKFNELSRIYIEKIKIIQIKGCSSELESRFNAAMKMAKELKDSKDLSLIFQEINDIRIINQATTSGCQLFYN